VSGPPVPRSDDSAQFRSVVGFESVRIIHCFEQGGDAPTERSAARAALRRHGARRDFPVAGLPTSAFASASTSLTNGSEADNFNLGVL
jgi:hypothetical protein